MNAPAGKIEAASLANAMAAAFAEIEGATKSTQGQVGQQKYKYADLTSVIDAIKPALINHGLFFTQHPEPSDKGVCIETVLHHAGGESLSLGKLFVPANKQDAQGFGSALTYARRYALVTAFGVPVEDDDGNAASKAAQGGSGKGQFGGATGEPTGPAINDTQWGELVQLIEVTNADVQAFCKAYRIDNLKALPASSFDRAKRQLNTKLSNMKEPANA